MFTVGAAHARWREAVVVGIVVRAGAVRAGVKADAAQRPLTAAAHHTVQRLRLAQHAVTVRDVTAAQTPAAALTAGAR